MSPPDSATMKDTNKNQDHLTMAEELEAINTPDISSPNAKTRETIRAEFKQMSRRTHLPKVGLLSRATFIIKYTDQTWKNVYFSIDVSEFTDIPLPVCILFEWTASKEADKYTHHDFQADRLEKVLQEDVDMKHINLSNTMVYHEALERSYRFERRDFQVLFHQLLMYGILSNYCPEIPLKLISKLPSTSRTVSSIGATPCEAETSTVYGDAPEIEANNNQNECNWVIADAVA